MKTYQELKDIIEVYRVNYEVMGFEDMDSYPVSLTTQINPTLGYDYFCVGVNLQYAGLKPKEIIKNFELRAQEIASSRGYPFFLSAGQDYCVFTKTNLYQ